MFGAPDAEALAACFGFLENLPMNTDWSKVEHNLEKANEQLEQASTEEQYQTVGLLCRETLISLAQVVYNPDKHTPTGDIIPSKTDAKLMLETYLKHELRSSTNEAARKHARSALELANALQHKRTASSRDAALCIEATTSVVKVIAIISGYLELASREAPYKKVQSMMPELIAEMSDDLRRDPLVREFFLASRSWTMNTPNREFIYYTEDHENLSNKLQILENYGFVLDVTTGNSKKYRMMEDFVEYLLALPGE